MASNERPGASRPPAALSGCLFFGVAMSATSGLSALARRVFVRLAGETVGVIDYIRAPERGSAWGGPFNGQSARQALFKMIIANMPPRAIIESGTYLGTTTDFMAKTGLPVFTIELSPRNYGFVRARFRRNGISR